MKTETLIELQRSITQGEWKTFAKWEPYQQKPSVQCGTEQIALCQDYHSHCYTEEQVNNARAIALVPELIAEVIRLREVLRACADQLDAETLGGEALDSARAALANDK